MVWTVDDIPDQSNAVILITGATSGVGLEAARVLANRRAHLVLVCRNKEKMANVADELRSKGAKVVDELECDLSDIESVRDCIESYGGPDIDVLLLNAGISTGTFAVNAQGLEKVFATNHLGHWLLTGMLLNKVKGRIVVVSSHNHAAVNDINWKNVTGEENNMDGIALYSQSKLANMLFVEELNRRFADIDSSVVAVGAHPGFTKTDILEKVENPGFFYQLSKILMPFLAQPAPNGAWPLLMAITDSNINRDCYYAPGNWRLMPEVYGPPISSGKKSPSVKDAGLAKRLWEESEKLCGFTYPF